MRAPLYLIVITLVFTLTSFGSHAQRASSSSLTPSEADHLIIEVRQLDQWVARGGIAEVPDSLGRKYVIGDGGVVYKLFNGVEPFIAHLKGYHPRPKANAQRYIIYLRSIEKGHYIDVDPSGRGLNEEGGVFIEYDTDEKEFNSIE